MGLVSCGAPAPATLPVEVSPAPPTTQPNSMPTAQRLTPTVLPQATNTAMIEFYADQTLLPSGGCTVLHWNVEDVSELHIDSDETIGHKDQEVCPTDTQTFTLTILHRDGHEEKRTITIEMTPPDK